MVRFLSPSPRAAALAAAFDTLPDLGVASDVCLVLGGDGSMLRAVHRHGGRYAYLGVNRGNLGFLMNDVAGTPAEVAIAVTEALRSEGYTRTAFPRLRVRARLVSEEIVEDLAVNDTYLERMSGQTCHLRVTVDGVVAVERMVADGIVVATPIGSTAYSFSAGGPAAHPLARAMVMTAICPHTPRLAPVVLPAGSRVRIEVLDAEHRPARVVVDGGQHGPVAEVEVRGGGDEVTLCFLAGHDFTATMIRKILHP